MSLVAPPEFVTLLFSPRPDWFLRAACRGADPDLFFTERGEPTGGAKATCDLCPVRSECLEHALLTREKFGIWGGKSERERRKIRQARGLTSGYHRRAS